MPRFVLTILTLLLQTLLAGAAFAPNAQELAVAALFKSDANQQRATEIYDETLSYVARARALDMAARGYFAHVNPDGRAANDLVRAAGYHLPAWWPTDPKLNYIESLAAGYDSAAKTWSAWLQSPSHKVHVLGETDFFRSQVRYGIGYANGGVYGHYWVILTAPHPWLEITSPSKSSTVKGSTVTLTGKTSTDSKTASIVARIENAGGTSAFRRASGTSKWSATLTDLGPGKNTVRIRSLNSSGSVICESVLRLISLPRLSVSATAGGSVTPAQLNGTTYHNVGTSLTLEAFPAPGYLFLRWSGDLVAKTARVSFSLSKSTTTKAEFVRNYFPASAGSFVGEIGDSRGLVRLKLGSTGALSGRVFFEGKTYSFSGVFPPDRTTTVTATSEGQPNLKLRLKLAVGSGIPLVKGTVIRGVESIRFESGQIASSNVAQAGLYILKASSHALKGSLNAELDIKSNGNVAINGSLPNGIPWSTGGYLGKNGTLYIYSKASDGSLIIGDLQFDSSPERVISGTLLWHKLTGIPLTVTGALK